ncbi:hypothetical protein [Acidovorax sp. FJL06]|uniref:hypothetical protein n=1 Tax=Acidovorax sp. FJL06 TaxID=2153365 RepID=UPI000F562E6A|nr:hypothetical protein [Acidovorax sp. FJL06]
MGGRVHDETPLKEERLKNRNKEQKANAENCFTPGTVSRLAGSAHRRSELYADGCSGQGFPATIMGCLIADGCSQA